LRDWACFHGGVPPAQRNVGASDVAAAIDAALLLHHRTQLQQRTHDHLQVWLAWQDASMNARLMATTSRHQRCRKRVLKKPWKRVCRQPGGRERTQARSARIPATVVVVVVFVLVVVVAVCCCSPPQQTWTERCSPPQRHREELRGGLPESCCYSPRNNPTARARASPPTPQRLRSAPPPQDHKP